jgi:hypothetical protein
MLKPQVFKVAKGENVLLVERKQELLRLLEVEGSASRLKFEEDTDARTAELEVATENVEAKLETWRQEATNERQAQMFEGYS